jgi:ABC-type antimicrobial peptide transport system permease subunit
MNISELFRQTFNSIFAHEMRSFLTMFGIIWGIASVILLVGLGRGFNKDQKDRLKTIGVDLAIIWGGANFFNVFNHPNFDFPDPDLSSSTFGTIITTVNTPTSPYGNFLGADASARIVQLNARITF